MKKNKLLIALLVLVMPLIIRSQNVSYQYDANGNRIARRIVAKKMNTPIAPTDSTTIANADTNLLNSLITQTANQTNNIINIYPNPTDDKLIISYATECQECIIKIYDANSKEVFRSQGLNREKVIDVSHFKSGNYYLSISNSTTKGEVWKIVKR